MIEKCDLSSGSTSAALLPSNRLLSELRRIQTPNTRCLLSLSSFCYPIPTHKFLLSSSFHPQQSPNSLNPYGIKLLDLATLRLKTQPFAPSFVYQRTTYPRFSELLSAPICHSPDIRPSSMARWPTTCASPFISFFEEISSYFMIPLSQLTPIPSDSSMGLLSFPLQSYPPHPCRLPLL